MTLISGFNVMRRLYLASDTGFPAAWSVLVLDMLENSFQNFRVDMQAEAVILLVIVLVLTECTGLPDNGGGNDGVFQYKIVAEKPPRHDVVCHLRAAVAATTALIANGFNTPRKFVWPPQSCQRSDIENFQRVFIETPPFR